MNNLPGNPFAQIIDALESKPDAAMVVYALLALGHEQHQRNRLAAITAKHRGIPLPEDLAHLAEED